MDIAVILPAWNRADTLPRALDSLKASAEDAARHGLALDWEAVVVDDASADDTVAVARAWGEANGHLRLIADGVRRRAGGARNRGAAASSAGLLCFLDADDEVLPQHLGIGVTAARSAPAACVFRTGISFRGLDMHPSWKPILERISATNFFIRRDWFLTLGGFPDTPRGEDVALRSFASALPSAAIPMDTVVYHRRPGNNLDLYAGKWAQPAESYQLQHHDHPTREEVDAFQRQQAVIDRRLAEIRAGRPAAEVAAGQVREWGY